MSADVKSRAGGGQAVENAQGVARNNRGIEDTHAAASIRASVKISRERAAMPRDVIREAHARLRDIRQARQSRLAGKDNGGDDDHAV